jgi:hypothetical protein
MFLLSFCFWQGALAQTTFKAGWKTYEAATIIKEYTYQYTHTDSMRITLTDSAITYIAGDSSVVMTKWVKGKDANVFCMVHYFGPKKQLLKTEEYKDNNLLETNEWRYDDKNRKLAHLRTNTNNKNVYKKLYEYSVEKKTGESVTSESAYMNGKIEFYTKMYYDKNNVLYKEVRLNDNNKDIVHVENFIYGENGKVKERSVYFPEFKVTKTFNEPAGNIPARCFGIKAIPPMERVNPTMRIPYLRRVIGKNLAALQDTTCPEYDYTFTNNVNCVISISSNKNHKHRTVRYRLKEKA